MNAYKLNEKNLLTALRFLAHFKRACDISEVSKGMALLEILIFVNKSSSLSLIVSITPRKDETGAFLLPDAGKLQNKSYSEAMSSLLKSYATDSKIAKTTLEIASIREASNETLAQFDDV